MPTPDLTPAQRHTRRTLRQHLRQRRRALTPGAQDAAARALAQQLSRLPALRNARRIAVYQSADGEIDPQALFRQSGWRHRDLALPALPAVGAGPLTFIRWNHRTRLRLNRFGISEPRPDRRHAMPAWTQDVVLLPLVAFDREGNRLGMGGGFYDRTLADLARRPRRPLLLGVAHHFQGVDRLPAAPWDVPLDGIVTDREYFVTG
ncbi:5-formyltetrahydrofolate cyclo-ligase [Isoalcanivorax indicus]|uniref:5-formyltetrahydrofolate cyclo-ligase n=1 Tax=Isoalcanivorax indicus TaxID=2202653 RepID=UPI000DBA0DAC|nr:5-formyltetrahydrofolate cyclo-ligase [Isoalcanivorax indicus]